MKLFNLYLYFSEELEVDEKHPIMQIDVEMSIQSLKIHRRT